MKRIDGSEALRRIAFSPVFLLLVLMGIVLLSGCPSGQNGDHFNEGTLHFEKGEYDKAISEYTKAIELDPRHDRAYNNRGIQYFVKKEYDRAWDDVRKVQSLGHQIDPTFLKLLREASVRGK